MERNWEGPRSAFSVLGKGTDRLQDLRGLKKWRSNYPIKCSKATVLPDEGNAAQREVRCLTEGICINGGEEGKWGGKI